MKKVLYFTLATTLISGCSGTLYTTKNPTITDGEEFKGVLFYGYKVVEKDVLLDRIRHKKTGDITHSIYEIPGTAKYCAPNIVKKKVVEADYDTTYSMRYQPGWFETNKFSVELDNGKLKSVNTESTPGVKTAVESLQGIADIREDILDGFVKESAQSTQKTLDTLSGKTAQKTPIKCSSNE